MTGRQGMAALRVYDLVAAREEEVDLDEALARIARRDARGDNYVELAGAAEAYPWFGIYLHGDHAAVHRFTGPDRCYLLLGDGSLSPIETVSFRDPHGPGAAVFTGEFVVRTATALRCVTAFAAGAPWPADCTWELL